MEQQEQNGRRRKKSHSEKIKELMGSCRLKAVPPNWPEAKKKRNRNSLV